MRKTPDEIFDEMKNAIIDGCVDSFDSVAGQADAEIEPTKDGFNIVLSYQGAETIRYRVTLTDLNAPVICLDAI